MCNLLFVLASCSTDVDINAPYVERPVVYAALDPGDSVNYIRVQKSFLTLEEQNAAKAAGVKDSVYYPSSALQVTLQPLNRRNLAVAGPAIILVEETVNTKADGIFYGPDQLLYKTPKVLLDTNALYRLRVRNTRTQKQVEAITNLIPKLKSGNLLEPAFNRSIGTHTFTSVAPVVFFRYNRADSTDRFRIEVTMPVQERLTDGSFRIKNVSWAYATDRETLPYLDNTSRYVTIREYQEASRRYTLFNILRSSLDTTDTQVAGRRMLTMQLTITRINKPLAQYIDANRGFSVLTQTRPFYSNIQGGIGVFASRSVSSFDCTIDPNFYVECLRRYPALKFSN